MRVPAWTLSLLAASARVACDRAAQTSSDPEGRSQSPRFGAGTAGGLGGNSGLGITGSFPAGGASAPRSGQGQPGVAPVAGNNSTPGGAVQR